MMKDILDKTELNSVSVDDVPGEYWFEDRSGEPVETSPTPGTHQSLKLLFKGSVWLDMVIELRMQFSRDKICALSKQICTVKTSDRFKMNL